MCLRADENICLLDVVTVEASGKSGTVVDIFLDGTLLVEFADGLGVMQDLIELSPSEVRLVWSANRAG